MNRHLTAREYNATFKPGSPTLFALFQSQSPALFIPGNSSPLRSGHERSHKRFANRVYFAFAATANFLRENNEELRYYSELYHVGVVVIALENDHYKSYSRGELVEIDTDLVDVYELFSAPFEARLRRWQKQFLEELQISNTRELWSWGEA